MNELTIYDRSQIASQMIRIPEFWCKTRLATSLAAAYEKKVLQDLLDEWNVPEYVQNRITDIIKTYWLDKVAE